MTGFGFGVDRLLGDKGLLRELRGKRVALLAHPASVTRGLEHTADALAAESIALTALFGPQHGMRGDKQDNMAETEDEIDPVYGIPVYSLYGRVRRPTASMLEQFDLLLVDLQDVGCRIYTYLTTVLYLMEDCARAGKSLWILDRPNPAGRPVDGLRLIPGQESFVGAAPMPMRHGLTLGEAAAWYRALQDSGLDLKVVPMTGYQPTAGPGFGWPDSRPWLNPSPNLPTLNAARVYPGTVILEGTSLSEGRGTTRPLECLGAPELPVGRILVRMRRMRADWMAGCHLRPFYFEPVFQKHAGARCVGVHVHTDHAGYDHGSFKPFRLVALFLKALRSVDPGYEIWRDFPYEYESGRLPIDVINGGPTLREWVDDPGSDAAELEVLLRDDERRWRDETAGFHIYDQ